MSPLSILIHPDPVLVQVYWVSLGIIFLMGAIHKLKDLALFGAVVDSYQLVPYAMVSVSAYTIVLMESVAGLLLLLPMESRTLAWSLSMVLLVLTTVPVIINLLRGHIPADCGCQGGELPQPLSWGLVIRNIVLILLLTWAGQEPSARVGGIEDGVTLVGGTIALVGIYSMINHLLSHRVMAQAIIMRRGGSPFSMP